jgi:DNA polymerase III subunit delta'
MSSSPRQAQALDYFRQALAARRPAHAYVVVGDVRGEARAFAEQALGLLFCERGGTPCGACAGCRQVAAHTHPDIVWVEPEMKSRIVGVDRIRELQRLVYQTSFFGGWKACVLVSADRLGDGASNAFLKTLEEPPPRCLFLLLTDTPQSLLPTIVSRCQRLVLSTEPVTLAEPWQERLLEIFAAPFDGSFVSRLARGARLLRLLRDLRAAVEREEKEAVADETVEVDKDTLEGRIEARYREGRAILLRSMLLWYRDILLCVAGCAPECYHHAARRERIEQAARGLRFEEALFNVQAIEDARRQLDQNLQPDLVFNLAASRLGA